MDNEFINFYQVLDVDRNSSEKEIEQAFQKKINTASNLEEKLIINMARAALLDQEVRQSFDKKLDIRDRIINQALTTEDIENKSQNSYYYNFGNTHTHYHYHNPYYKYYSQLIYDWSFVINFAFWTGLILTIGGSIMMIVSMFR